MTIQQLITAVENRTGKAVTNDYSDEPSQQWFTIIIPMSSGGDIITGIQKEQMENTSLHSFEGDEFIKYICL